jgi:hypothetical protein
MAVICSFSDCMRDRVTVLQLTGYVLPIVDTGHRLQAFYMLHSVKFLYTVEYKRETFPVEKK